MANFLIGVVVGVGISMAIRHWDAVGPALARAWAELKGLVGK